MSASPSMTSRRERPRELKFVLLSVKMDELRDRELKTRDLGKLGFGEVLEQCVGIERND